jgi:hypothetical protein
MEDILDSSGALNAQRVVVLPVEEPSAQSRRLRAAGTPVWALSPLLSRRPRANRANP